MNSLTKADSYALKVAMTLFIQMPTHSQSSYHADSIVIFSGDPKSLIKANPFISYSQDISLIFSTDEENRKNKALKIASFTLQHAR